MKINQHKLPKLYQEHAGLLKANVLGMIGLASADIILSSVETIAHDDPTRLMNLPVAAYIGLNSLNFFRNLNRETDSAL